MECQSVKKFLPFIIAGLGLAFVIISMVLRNGTADAQEVITNITSTFMLVAGCICVLVGIVTFFLRDDTEIW